jgi:heme-degrading monooxygenase HmoA
MPTVLSFERYPVHPASVAPFETTLDDVVGTMREAPGALWADAARARDDDPSYLLLSEWRTEADLQAWDDGRAFGEFTDRTDALVREAPTRRRFTSPD